MVNREFKFKIWTGSEFFDHTFTGIMEDYGIDSLEEFFNHKELKIQQFTGLLDINNKEIYEGDIVEINTKEIRLVKWDTVELKWGLQYKDFPTFCENLSNYKNSIKVVGNIFENKDLFT